MTDLDTHHDFCWQGHHACAIRRVEDLTRERDEAWAWIRSLQDAIGPEAVEVLKTFGLKPGPTDSEPS